MILRIKLLLIYNTVFLFNTKLISIHVVHLYRGELQMKAAKKKEIPVRIGP